eukprot:70541_1
MFSDISASDYLEQTRFIVWITISCLSWSIGIATLIGYFKFKKLTHLLIVQRRYPNIVLLESKLSMIISFILVPLVQATPSKLESWKEYQHYIDTFTYLFYPTCHLVIGCEICRLWLICYDLNYLHASLNSQWKSQINNELIEETNWWIQNKKTYGNYKYVTNRITIFFCATGITVGIMYLIWTRNSITMIPDSALYGIPILFTIWEYYKCPKTVDKFLFEFEFKTTVIVFVSALVMYVIGQIIVFFDLWIGETFITFVGMYAFLTVSLVSTLYIPYKIMSNKIWKHQINGRSFRKISSIHDRNLRISIHGRVSTAQPKRRRVGLTDIFSNQIGLELFAIHLSNEFSLECVLSLIEMIQFKSYLNVSFNKSNENDFVILDKHKIKFAFDTPLKSSIVYGNEFDQTSEELDEIETINKFKMSALLLYRKYISQYSELEVNISYSLRAHYYDLMADENSWMKLIVSFNELFELFDPVCKEMLNLMEHSLVRFILSSDIVNKLKINVDQC